MNTKLARGENMLLVWLAAGLTALGAENGSWLTVFDEQFAEHPLQDSRYKLLPDGCAASRFYYNKTLRTFRLGGEEVALVRPVVASANVELSMTLRFTPPEERDPAELETGLMLVLSNQSMAGVRVCRSKKAGAQTVGKFVYAQEKNGRDSDEVLREIQLPSEPPDGVWRLCYRYGLITLAQGSNTVGSAYANKLGPGCNVSVIGVLWQQKGGSAVCARMTLKGEPIRKLAAADQATLQRASRFNDEALQLLKDNKAREALAKMKEASALFVQVHGEDHHDSGNSYANIAHIMKALGSFDEAERFLDKALAIHERTLGATHPHTTLTRFWLGDDYQKKGDMAKAKALWTRCCDDWTAVVGPEYGPCKALAQLLPRLGSERPAVAAKPPADMVLIPAGSFEMGDCFAEGNMYERPVRTVHVSAFYMDKTEVTWAKWREVCDWAATNGMSDLTNGLGKADSHPVHSVSFSDAVKWCNARSLKEGRAPCYRMERCMRDNRQYDVVRCNWSANGYRLPTEAEWEKAARGGLAGKRFPCGDTLQHNLVNYRSFSDCVYDENPTAGYHPSFTSGGEPYTSPVGSLPPNGYGLYDMAGNVTEWCWAINHRDPSLTLSDPRDPTYLSAMHAVRGGSWASSAQSCRVSASVTCPQDQCIDFFGFRCVLSAGQQ